MSTLTASGGFCAPSSLYGKTPANTGISFALAAFNITALRGGIDFSPPEVRWARKHELDLRRSAKMWDWTLPPSVSM